MRILLVNDDGPPSDASPYFGPWVAALRQAGHTLVVVIPDRPMSWISKAHTVGKTIRASTMCPRRREPIPTTAPATHLLGPHTPTNTPLQAAAVEPAVLLPDAPETVPGDSALAGPATELHGQSHLGDSQSRSAAATCDCAANTDHWLVIDGPPATCVHIGLFHSGFRPADFDLVVSGPNHGRNASALYVLSSGTVGGALEAALCGRRAVALSFADKRPQPASRIAAACARAVRLVEELVDAWPRHEDVQLYNVNVPMVDDVGSCPVRYDTFPAAVGWHRGGLFEEIPAGKETLPGERQFRWAPDLRDVKDAEEISQEGGDLWSTVNGIISVTPLRANMEVRSTEAAPDMAQQGILSSGLRALGLL